MVSRQERAQLTKTRWDADAARDDLRAYVVEHLSDPGAALVVGETGLLTNGTKPVEVARQYSGTVGRIESCRAGVFLAHEVTADACLPAIKSRDRVVRFGEEQRRLVSG